MKKSEIGGKFYFYYYRPTESGGVFILDDIKYEQITVELKAKNISQASKETDRKWPEIKKGIIKGLSRKNIDNLKETGHLIPFVFFKPDPTKV